MMLYGCESFQVWVLVVSLTGSSWMTFIPTVAAQSAIILRSVKSPTPQLRSDRSANKGTTTPAAFHVVSFTRRESP